MERNILGNRSQDAAVSFRKFNRQRCIRTFRNGKLLHSFPRRDKISATIEVVEEPRENCAPVSVSAGNEYNVVDDRDGFWRDDFAESCPSSSARPLASSGTIEQYFSSADGFSGNFQVHFLQATVDDKMPAAVCMFVGGLRERRLSFVCTGVHCTFSKSNLGLVYGTDSFTELEVTFCEHAEQVMRRILSVRGIVPEDNNIRQQVFQQIDVPGSDITGVYIADSDFGRKGRPILFVDDSYEVELVYYWSSQLWCHYCKRGKPNLCRHLRHAYSMSENSCWTEVMKRLSEESSGVVQQDRDLQQAKQLARQLKVDQEFRNAYIQPREMIRFSNRTYARVVRERGFQLKKWMQKTYGKNRHKDVFLVYPEIECCSKCYGAIQYRRVIGDSYFCGCFMMPVEVYVACCKNSGCDAKESEVSYSGNDDFVVNYNNHLIIPIELVEEYLRYYTASALTVSAWWDEKTSAYTRIGIVDSLNLTLNQLRARRGQISTAIAGTAELLNLSSAYKCCDHPQTVSMDGIVLSTLRIAMPKFSKPWIMEGVERSRASHRAERQLPRLTEEQSKLIEVLLLKDGAKRSRVKNNARNTRNAALKLFLLLCYWKFDSHGFCHCPSGVREFAKFMKAEVAPVTSLIPYDYWDDFELVYKTSGETRCSHMKELCVNAPQIYRLVVEVEKVANKSYEKIWRVYGEFVKQMKKIKTEIFASNEDGLYRELGAEEIENIQASFERKHPENPDLNELWSTGCYFPNFPIVRVVKEVQLTRKERLYCHKEQAIDAGCMPGILLFYCVRHECCIGFVVLDGAESPRVVYEVLATRFLRMPQNVIYDNGCNLSEYVLNRTPYLYRRTQIMVDGFHFHSHKSCASCFSTEQNARNMEKLNTSLFKQRNARLTKLKETAPLMRARVFMAMVRMAVSNPNVKHKYKQLINNS